MRGLLPVRGLLIAGIALLGAAPLCAQDGAAVYTQRCSTCHDSTNAANRAPRRDVLAAFTIDRIVSALESGLMREQGDSMSAAERRAVASYLSTASPPAANPNSPGPKACASDSGLRESNGLDWNGWGVDLANYRFARDPGLRAAQVPQLSLKWAFGFEGETSAATQPIIVGDWVFVGSTSGRVYALGLQDGCTHWTFKADGGVRAAVRLVQSGGGLSAIVADLRATVYSLDARTGQLQWKVRVEDHRASRISGSPVFAVRSTLRPRVLRRGSDRVSARLRMLHLPRKRRRARCRKRHRWRGRPISFPIRRSRSGETRSARSCGVLPAPPSGRRQRST